MSAIPASPGAGPGALPSPGDERPGGRPTELLKALRITIRADSDPSRKALFEGLRRSSRSARFAQALHARLGRGRLSSLLVSLYGVRALLGLNWGSDGRNRILGLAVHANARHALDRVAAWLPAEDLRRVATGRRALPGSLLALLGPALSPSSAAKGLRVIHAINRRHDFLVSCRAAGLLAAYASAGATLAKRRPRAILVSSDTNPEEVAFAAAARARGIPTIFIAHTYPTPFSPPLDFSLSLLEGEAAAEAWSRKGPIGGATVLVGLEGPTRPIEPGRFARRRPVVGLCAPKAVSWPKLAEVIGECRREFDARRILVRWHPSMLEPSRLAECGADGSVVAETPGSWSLERFASECDWIVADPNSNVHLPVLKLGIPTVAIPALSASSASRADIFGFVANGIVLERASLASWSQDAAEAFFSSGWRERFARYDAAAREEPETIAAGVRAAVLGTAPAIAETRAEPSARGSRALSLVVSSALLLLLYRSLDPSAIAATFSGARPGWLIASIGMIVPLTLLRSFRFAWIAPRGAVPSMAEALRLTLVASAFNMFLPSKAGDLVKSFFVARGGAGTGVSIAIVVYERVSDLMGMAFWCSIGYWLFRPALPDAIPPSVGVLFAVMGAACAALVLSGRLADRLPVPGASSPAGPKGRKLRDLAQGWPALHRGLAGRRLAIAGVSLALWLAHLTQIWMFTVALSMGIPFAACATLAAIALMAGQIPLTFGGLGARDLAFVLLLSGYASRESAAALGLLSATRTFLPPLAALPILRPYLARVLEAGREWRRS